MAKVTVREAHALPLAPALARGRPVQPGPVPRPGRPTPKTQNTVPQLTAKSKRKDTRPPRSATSFNRHRAGAPSSTTVAPLRFRAGGDDGNAKPRRSIFTAFNQHHGCPQADGPWLVGEQFPSQLIRRAELPSIPLSSRRLPSELPPQRRRDRNIISYRNIIGYI
jgi:hypothetical protein